MKNHITFLLAFLLAASLSFAATKSPGSYTYINSCQDLASPNAHYVLTSDIQASGTCFRLLQPGITLDCNGHTVTLTDTVADYGAYSNQPSSTVRNCNFQNFNYGIYFQGVNNGFITNNIAVAKSIGIYSTGGSYDTISGNSGTVDANDYGIGISIEQGGHNTITNNIGTGLLDPSNGISISESDHNTVIENTGTAPNVGIMFWHTDYGTILNNRGSGNWGFGLDVEYSSYNTIQGNTGTASTPMSGALFVWLDSNHNNVSGNTAISDTGTALGIHQCSYNNVFSNTAVSNSGNAVDVGEYASYNTLTGNIMQSNTGTALYISSDSGNNAFNHNTIRAPVWVNNGNTANSFNTPAQGNTYYLADGTPSWNVYDISDSNNDNYADCGSARPFSSGTVGSRWQGAGADWHPYTTNHISPLQCNNQQQDSAAKK